jgi:hypothetical protein
MNTNIQSIAFCLLLTVGAWLPLAAETGAASKIEVAHSFRAGGTLLPAGSYVIRVVSTSSDQPLLSLESVNGGTTLLLAARHCDTSGGETSSQSGATFTRKQDQLQLTQVWFGGRVSGYELIALEN